MCEHAVTKMTITMTDKIVMAMCAGVTVMIPTALHLVETEMMTTMTTTMGMTMSTTTEATQQQM